MVIINVKQYPSLFHEDVHHTHMAYLPSYRAHVRQRCNTGTLPCNAMISTQVSSLWGCPGGTSGKEPACQRKRRKRCGFHPGSGRSLGGGHGNPLQYSCLENPMDRGAWKVLDRRVIQSQTQLKWLSTHAISTITVPKSWSAKIMCRLPWPHVCTGSHTTYTQQVRLPRTLAAEGLNIPAS